MYRRIVHLMATLLLLSACAQHGPGRYQVAGHQAETQRQRSDAAASSVRGTRSYPRAAAHHHRPPSPTPEEEYTAMVAMLISAQIFTCAFFVVILDGHCSFYAGTGFYY